MGSYTRFRTPRTATTLTHMYEDAIDIPTSATPTGPDTTAPISESSSSVESEDSAIQQGRRKGKWVHHAHLIDEIGHRVYSVTASEEVGAVATIYDVPKLAEMFPTFTSACRRFALEEDVEPEGFIACAVYALCEPTTASQRHNVYRRIAFEAFYQTCTEFPDYMYEAIRSTWSYPGEVFGVFLPTHVRQQRHGR